MEDEKQFTVRLLKLTINAMRPRGNKDIEVFGYSSSEYRKQLASEGKFDYSLCQTYSCKYALGYSKPINIVLDDDFINPLLNRLQTISIPLLTVQDRPGIDGTWYQLMIGSHPTAEFRWWSRYPESWQPLAKIAGELEKHVGKAAWAHTHRKGSG